MAWLCQTRQPGRATLLFVLPVSGCDNMWYL
jgi:hypothetical protein